MELPLTQIILRLVVAALLGSVIGMERERLNWVAGLRTHMLVAVGSCLAMIVSVYGFSEVLGKSNIQLDPSRVAAQVVSGIGFLGAGTIFFWRKEVIRGLTTAAALWAVASIGLAIGGGLYTAGITTTLLVLIILALMKPLEKKIFKNSEVTRHSLTLKFFPEKISLKQIETSMESIGLNVLEMKMKKIREEDTDADFLFELVIMGEAKKLLDLADKMKSHEGIHSLSYN